ncbi:MAG: hypothetical protein M1840_000082 [Geoglossum simile]|nr:MAG: hypothetical protein M1840_000082 [Geoglossum simile]
MSRSNLPFGWSTEHDIFICHLDAKGYFLDAICYELRNEWINFKIEGIKEVNVDRRLRVLDQSCNNFFARNVTEFKWAKRFNSTKDESREKRS